MPKISTLLNENKIVIADGAWGTQLINLGLPSGYCPELWNIENPKAIAQIAADYIEAGAMIIETNSFGANRFKLQNFGLENRVEELNIKAAQISRKESGNNIAVMGSIGPTGKFLIIEEVSAEEMYLAFKEQAVALEKGGVDAICIETFYDIEEAECAINAVRENTRLEIICSFTFQKNDLGFYRTIAGYTPGECAAFLVNAKINVIGANCGCGFAPMIRIAEDLINHSHNIPVMIRANAGSPQIESGRIVYPEAPEYVAQKALELEKTGVRIIGGCCGTSPAHIKAIKQSVS